MTQIISKGAPNPLRHWEIISCGSVLKPSQKLKEEQCSLFFCIFCSSMGKYRWMWFMAHNSLPKCIWPGALGAFPFKYELSSISSIALYSGPWYDQSSDTAIAVPLYASATCCGAIHDDDLTQLTHKTSRTNGKSRNQAKVEIELFKLVTRRQICLCKREIS